MKILNLKKERRGPPTILAENMTKLLELHRLSESDLARDLRLPYNTINRIVSGITTDPRISTLEQIANYFGVSIDFLLGSLSEREKEGESKIPVLTWESILELDFLQNFVREKWDKWVPAAQLLGEITDIDKVFALESTKSMYPRFPLGTLFVIKADELPMDGDLVLVRFRADNSLSLRELVIDAPDWQLNPIILSSKGTVFSHMEHAIVGVVVLTLIQPRVF